MNLAILASATVQAREGVRLDVDVLNTDTTVLTVSRGGIQVHVQISKADARTYAEKILACIEGRESRCALVTDADAASNATIIPIDQHLGSNHGEENDPTARNDAAISSDLTQAEAQSSGSQNGHSVEGPGIPHREGP